MRLARMLGRQDMPQFLHHPLVLKPGGGKLSKANRDTGVRELRRQGASAAEVIGRAAHAVGLTMTPSDISANQVSSLFG